MGGQIQKGELGELGSPSALYSKQRLEKVNIQYGHGARPNSPDSLLALAQIQNSNSPFENQLPDDEDLSATKLGKMLEEYVGLTSPEVVKLWKKKGKPEVPLGQGVKIRNLETYLNQGIINMEHLGILGELIKEWKK